jgi:hypothetical protein
MYVGIMLVSMPIAIIGKEFNLYYDKAFRYVSTDVAFSYFRCHCRVLCFPFTLLARLISMIGA